MTLPRLRCLLVLIALVITPVVAVTASSTLLLAASPLHTLTIRNWACPVAYPGATFADDCQEPVANMEFSLTAPEAHAQTATTDATGAVTFANLPPGTYEVTGGPPGEFVQNAIVCHLAADPPAPLPFLPRDNRAIGVTLDNASVTCDWFSIPFDLRGD